MPSDVSAGWGRPFGHCHCSSLDRKIEKERPRAAKTARGLYGSTGDGICEVLLSGVLSLRLEMITWMQMQTQFAAVSRRLGHEHIRVSEFICLHEAVQSRGFLSGSHSDV